MVHNIYFWFQWHTMFFVWYPCMHGLTDDQLTHHFNLHNVYASFTDCSCLYLLYRIFMSGSRLRFIFCWSHPSKISPIWLVKQWKQWSTCPVMSRNQRQTPFYVLASDLNELHAKFERVMSKRVTNER